MCQCASAIIAALFLAYAGITDWHTREVEPKLWYVAVPLTVAIYLYELYPPDTPTLIFYLLNWALVALFFFLYWRGLVGGADVGAAAVIASVPACPGWFPFPTLIATLLYAAPAAIAWRAAMAWRLCGIKCVLRRRIRAPGRDLAKAKWWMVEGATIDNFDAKLEAIKNDDRLYEAQPLIPFVSVLTVGYLILLVAGADPIIVLFETIA